MLCASAQVAALAARLAMAMGLAGLAVSDEMAVAHDEAAAIAPVFAFGKFGMMLRFMWRLSPAPVVASAAGSQKSVWLSNSFAPFP